MRTPVTREMALKAWGELEEQFSSFKKENQNLKKAVYYIYHEKTPTVTISIIYDTKENEAFRGVSILGEGDNPDKAIGRMYAFGRAMKAFRDRKSRKGVIKGTVSNRLRKLHEKDKSKVESMLGIELIETENDFTHEVVLGEPSTKLLEDEIQYFAKKH